MGSKNTMDVEEGEFPIAKLKKYVAYARAKIAPRLSEEAALALQNLYVADRKSVAEGK